MTDTIAEKTMRVVSCALNNAKTDITFSDEELSRMYALCKMHKITVLAAAGLRLCGIHDKRFEDEYLMAIRREIMISHEYDEVCSYFESAGIWYLPLKGCVIKHIYPAPFLREMADNDILFDESFRKQVKQFFVSRGYEARAYGGPIEDAYMKNPVYHFEMHVSLFDPFGKDDFEKYYASGLKFTREEGKSRRLFSPEDFLVYTVSHMSKHYTNCGTGLRNLCDIYVYLNHFKELDSEYIRTEMEKAGVYGFFTKLKKLSFSMLDNPDAVIPDEESMALFDELTSSGVYGNTVKMVSNRLNKMEVDRTDIDRAKRMYVKSRLFPDREFYRNYCPFAYRYPFFIPFVWLKRTVKVIFVHQNAKAEMKALKKIKE